ncbi:MAG: hypothetical protein WCF65_04095 [Parachlamydiaceae bacterium]
MIDPKMLPEFENRDSESRAFPKPGTQGRDGNLRAYNIQPRELQENTFELVPKNIDNNNSKQIINSSFSKQLVNLFLK